MFRSEERPGRYARGLDLCFASLEYFRDTAQYAHYDLSLKWYLHVLKGWMAEGVSR